MLSPEPDANVAPSGLKANDQTKSLCPRSRTISSPRVTSQSQTAPQVLPGVRHPDLINDQPRLIGDSLVVPDEAMDIVPAPLRHFAGLTQEPSALKEEILR